MKKKVIIGLTGGIGSGKTAATDILLGQNAYIIDTDIIARQVSGEILPKLFPQCVFDGEIDRECVRKIVFSDQKARENLEKTTHPLILKRVEELLKEGINIVAVPLLFESGFDQKCDYILGIIADENLRIGRLKARDKSDENTLKSIIKSQISSEELAQKCDYIIENNGEYKELEKKVVEWYLKLRERFI